MTKTDKEFILNEDCWPCWPFLPMKRDREHGFLVPKSFNIHLENIFRLSSMTEEQRLKIKKIEYVSVDALLADGWCID